MARNRQGAASWAAAMGVVALALAPAGEAAPTAQRQAGQHAGIWSWTLPDTPGGTVPKQSWSGAGAGPSGEIYVGGMDHVANAALYRLGPGGGDASRPGSTLTYVGDARAASQAAGNLKPGEPIEKFHTQPTFFSGRIYVANMNFSDLDSGYLGVRGFHWYGYDRTSAKFLDLTANRPGGVALAHGGVPGLGLDRVRGRIYGTVTPTGEIVEYTPATGSTVNLGRPAYGRAYVYPGRTLWVGSTGRVYFTAGNPATGSRAGGPYDPALFNHVRYWDPASRRFGEERGWQLHDTRAIDYAQCFDWPAPRTCFLMDNVGHVYRYSENTGLPPWTFLGDIGQKRDELYGLTWVFQVRPNGKRAYIVARRGAFFEFDLITGVAALRGNLYLLEPALTGLDFFGNSAWDANGRFYVSAFPKLHTDPGRARLVAIDPWRFIPAIR